MGVTPDQSELCHVEASDIEPHDVNYAVLSSEEQARLLDLQQAILVSVARGVDHLDVINQICKLEEGLLPNSVASVMLLDEKEEVLNVYAAPSVPPEGIAQLNGLRPGPGGGSCGNVIYTQKPQFVGNTFTDARWCDLRQLAHNFHLRACWSVPIFSSANKLVGTFALSSLEHRSPTPFHRKLLDIGSYIVGIVLERNKDEMALRVAATAFESQEGMLITDADGNILRVNKAFTEITGYMTEDVVGKNPSLLSSGRQDRRFYSEMWQSINDTGAWKGEIWNRRKNGEIYPEFLAISVVKSDEEKVTNYVASLSDITQHKKTEQEVRRLAFYDQLTSLPNRRLLLDRIKQAVSYSSRNQKYGALLFIDLDNFKILNDTLGHAAGDTLLEEVAKRLTACIRQGDTASRLGGDEFVVMLEDLSAHALEASEQAKLVGEKIIAALGKSYDLGSTEFSCTASIGVTLFHGHHAPDEDLLKQADIAMYQAKKAGRNTLRFFDRAMQDSINERATLEAELRRALDRGQFRLYYQLQVNAAHKPVGAEVLLRWQHPERGLVPPGDFIPLAEETGLIVPLAEWVLNTACAQIKAWKAHPEFNVLPISVNISAPIFYQPDFVDLVKSIVRTHDVGPMQLKLELTESLALKDVDAAIQIMGALREIGIVFSLDDFGTGFSSLAYLKRLPLDEIKIDQSFVKHIIEDNADKVMVMAIAGLGMNFELNTVAEGVETEAQFKLLHRCGCQTFQGYLFSKPLPLEQFEPLIRKLHQA